MGWRGWASGGNDTKRKLYPRKIHFFVMEKCIEDAKQEEKDVPDLLEAIMRPTCLVKEELRPILYKMAKFIYKSKKSEFQLFGFRKSDGFPPEANASLLAARF